jgi:hypothetical protein
MWNIVKLLVQLILAILAYYYGATTGKKEGQLEGYQKGCQEEAVRQERKWLERLRKDEPVAVPEPRRLLPLRYDGPVLPRVDAVITPTVDWTPLDEAYAVPQGDKLVRVYPEQASKPIRYESPRFPVVRRLLRWR